MTEQPTTPDYLGHRERLRKRFLSNYGKDMADYELIELLLTMAIPRRDVKPLAKALIRKFGDFAGVVSASKEDLMSVSGIKESSVVVLKAVQIGAQRLSWQKFANTDAPVLATWDEMIDYCRTKTACSPIEELHIIYLDAKLKVIAEELLQKGTIDGVVAHPREIIKEAMNKNASAIILVHNHPSGDVTPSGPDKEVTIDIKKAAELVNITLLDHIIIGKNAVFSFKDCGII